MKKYIKLSQLRLFCGCQTDPGNEGGEKIINDFPGEVGYNEDKD